MRRETFQWTWQASHLLLLFLHFRERRLEIFVPNHACNLAVSDDEQRRHDLLPNDPVGLQLSPLRKLLDDHIFLSLKYLSRFEAKARPGEPFAEDCRSPARASRTSHLDVVGRERDETFDIPVIERFVPVLNDFDLQCPQARLHFLSRG